MIVDDQKAQVLWMKYCYSRLAEMTKKLGCIGIKTSLDVVAVAPATLLQGQVRFHVQ